MNNHFPSFAEKFLTTVSRNFAVSAPSLHSSFYEYVQTHGSEEEKALGSQSLGRALKQHLASLAPDAAYDTVEAYIKKHFGFAGLESATIRVDTYHSRATR